MNEVITIGLDLAKNVFQVHGVDDEGNVVTLSGHSGFDQQTGVTENQTLSVPVIGNSAHCLGSSTLFQLPITGVPLTVS